MANFQHYITGTKSENIEFYIGKGSGKKIQKDIENVKNEIIIISPYVSEEKIDLLFKIKKRGVNIKLAFSSLNDNQNHTTLQKLIQRKTLINEPLKKKIEDKIKILKIKSISNILFSLSVLLIGCYLFVLDIIKNELFFFRSIILIMVFLIFLVINNSIKVKNKKLLNTKIISFKYEKKIDFTYLNNNFRNDKMFVHSKIYIIDDNIAYLGSVNFTNKGFKENLETRIRITDKETINKLKQFTNELFEENKNVSHKLSWLGQTFYNINSANLTYQAYLNRKSKKGQSTKLSNFNKIISRNTINN